MTLADLLAGGLPDVPTLRGLALVFGDVLCQRLANVQAWYGDDSVVPIPASTTDGRWMLCADVLTECRPGGILWAGFSHLDPAGFVGIEVVQLADVTLADPPLPPIQPEQKPSEELP